MGLGTGIALIVIGAILALMAVVREAGEWGRLKQQALTPARRKRYEVQHRALVAALRERDAVRARRALALVLVLRRRQVSSTTRSAVDPGSGERVTRRSTTDNDGPVL